MNSSEAENWQGAWRFAAGLSYAIRNESPTLSGAMIPIAAF